LGKGQSEDASSSSERTESKYVTNLAYGQDVINVQALEQGPHGEVDVNQTTTKVKTAWEARDNLQTGVTGFILRTGIELYEISSTGGRMCKDL
jgi:hypothetical protein